MREIILRATREVSFEIHEKIVNRTPIDTGRAKASWRINENVADPSVEPQLADRPNGFGGISRAAAGESPLYANQALAVARSRQQLISDTASKIVISNNLDYIENLENGTSQQAPGGMVAVTVTQDAVEQMFADALNRPF